MLQQARAFAQSSTCISVWILYLRVRGKTVCVCVCVCVKYMCFVGNRAAAHVVPGLLQLIGNVDCWVSVRALIRGLTLKLKGLYWSKFKPQATKIVSICEDHLKERESVCARARVCVRVGVAGYLSVPNIEVPLSLERPSRVSFLLLLCPLQLMNRTQRGGFVPPLPEKKHSENLQRLRCDRTHLRCYWTYWRKTEMIHTII